MTPHDEPIEPSFEERIKRGMMSFLLAHDFVSEQAIGTASWAFRAGASWAMREFSEEKQRDEAVVNSERLRCVEACRDRDELRDELTEMESIADWWMGMYDKLKAKYEPEHLEIAEEASMKRRNLWARNSGGRDEK